MIINSRFRNKCDFFILVSIKLKTKALFIMENEEN